MANPLQLTRSDIESRLVACMQKIYDLRQQSPHLRKQHLQWCLTRAQHKSDHIAKKEIQEIIKNGKGQMPAGILKEDEEIVAVADWLADKK